MTFKIKRHIEIDTEYQGINLTEFSFTITDEFNNDLLVDNFIRSKHFSYDSLRDSMKKQSATGFLGQAFDIERINIKDFKKYNKQQTTKFLIDFLNEPDWADDKNDFAKLLEQYFEIQDKLENEYYYILSKDWFDKNDNRVFEPQNFCYIYYFLIIYIDRASKTLILTEWAYD